LIIPQLIKILRQPNEVRFYVTDYTPHPELLSHRHEMDWSRSLEGRILGIVLYDVQTQYADRFSPGAYLSIKNLRLKHDYQKRFLGMLGGSDILVNKLNPQKPNEHLQALCK
jgi:hypothetical protein